MECKWKDYALGIVFFGAIGVLIILPVMSVKEQNKFTKACLVAGGVPLQEHCVRPGAFMEVNP